MKSDNKNVVLRIRTKAAEYAHLKALADSSYINISDYVRRRLFDEDIADVADSEDKTRPPTSSLFNCNHDQEVMRTLVRVLALTKSVAKQSLPQEDFQDAYDAAKQQLQDWGYE